MTCGITAVHFPCLTVQFWGIEHFSIPYFTEYVQILQTTSATPYSVLSCLKRFVI